MSHADTAVDVEFDSRGLVPVVAQDADSGQVLMLAYASAAAIAHTTETGLAHYYSRSRERVWQKGKTSGHVQQVEEIRIDCDGDAMVYSVAQEGGACHTGYETCFYRQVEDVSIDEGASATGDGPTGTEADTATDSDGSTAAEERDSPDGLTVETRVVAERVFDPDTVYE